MQPGEGGGAEDARRGGAWTPREFDGGIVRGWGGGGSIDGGCLRGPRARAPRRGARPDSDPATVSLSLTVSPNELVMHQHRERINESECTPC